MAPKIAQDKSRWPQVGPRHFEIALRSVLKGRDDTVTTPRSAFDQPKMTICACFAGWGGALGGVVRRANETNDARQAALDLTCPKAMSLVSSAQRVCRYEQNDQC